MPDEFPYDVFLSHSAKDKRSKPPTSIHGTGGNAVVRPLAERLRADGVKGMHKAEGKRQKYEIQLQPSSFFLHPFPHAPLNKERRFLPLRGTLVPKVLSGELGSNELQN